MNTNRKESRKILITFLLLAAAMFLTISLLSCTTVSPVLRTSCDIIQEICAYQSIICDTLSVEYAIGTNVVYRERVKQLSVELEEALERENND